MSLPRVDGEEDALSRDMGSVAVSDESSEQRRAEAVGPRRYRLSKQELQVYRRAMAPGDREEVCQGLSCVVTAWCRASEPNTLAA